MTVREAVYSAKKHYGWLLTHKPITVAVGFNGNDETTFDLYGDDEDKVKELEELWKNQYREMESSLDGIDYVKAHEYGWE